MSTNLTKTNPSTVSGSRTRARIDRGLRRYLPISTVTLACLGFYLFHSLAGQAKFRSTGYDLGIFDQAVRAYAHFQAPMVPLKGSGYNIWGDHFHPIIVLLAPLYWIWDNPDMLLIAQAVLTAASIPVVYRFTRRRTSEAMALLVAAAYGFGWPIQALIDFDFHEVAFATPLTALAIDALDRRDDRRLLLWCGLLLLVREDMGLIVALFGLLRLTQRRPSRRVPLILVAGGIATYLVATSVIIPHFASGDGFAYGNQFGSLGSSMPAALINAVTQPWHAVAVFFSPAVKASTLAFLLVPLAFLPLRSPYALIALPLMAERFFNSRHNLWKTVYHYNALPWLVLLLAMIDGAARMGLFDANRRALLWRRALASLLVVTPVLLIFIGPASGVVPITQLRPGHVGPSAAWQRDAEATLARIADDVCIAADNHLVPHLTSRDWTTVAQAHTPDPDFYVIDLSAADTGGNPPAPKPLPVYLAALQSGYHTVFSVGSFVILQSADYRGPSPQCHPLGPGKSR